MQEQIALYNAINGDLLGTDSHPCLCYTPIKD